MAEIFLTKGPGGQLLPQDDDALELVQKLKPGTPLRCSITREVNARFRRKWWALAKYAFDIWSDTCPEMQYQGQPVQPSFDRFRRDLTILAGHYTPVFNARGELRVEAKSLAWSRMSEEVFERLYSATIDAVLQKVLRGTGLTERQLRDHVDRVMSFA